MQSFAPYRITHIDLAAPLPALPQLHDGGGQYLLFWWRHLVLGHLFVAPEEQLTEAALRSKAAQLVSPALQHYTRAKNTGAPWQQWLQQGNTEAFHQWAEAYLASFTCPEQNQSVPVSVIICTRNRAAQLRQCLQSLTELQCRPQEIVVVDNAPDDDTTQKAAAAFPGVVYVREARPGLDVARNTGIRNASCPIVAFTDDDVQVHPTWVYRIWESFEQHPHVAAITGLVIAAKLDTQAQLIFEKSWSFNRGFTDNFYGPEYLQKTLHQGPPVWEIGAGANMAFRKNIFEKVGYFNEILDAGAAGCCGDSEIWFRILAAGGTIHYNPRVITFHEHRSDIPGLKKQLFYYMRGHVTAALIQQKQLQRAGYRRHLMVHLPKYYAVKLKQGFPFYRLRYCTLSCEISGVLSGYIYYLRNRRHSINQPAA